MKRFRKPKLKDGQLLVYWGKLPHDEPDVIYSWQGDSSMKRDNALLCYHFGSRRPDPMAKPLYSKMDPSLLEELEARGYDITTLRFSIMKKTANDRVEGRSGDETAGTSRLSAGLCGATTTKKGKRNASDEQLSLGTGQD